MARRDGLFLWDREYEKRRISFLREREREIPDIVVQTIRGMQKKYPKEMTGAFSSPFGDLPYDLEKTWGTYHIGMYSWTAVVDDPIEAFLGCYQLEYDEYNYNGLWIVPSVAADVFESSENGSEKNRDWHTLTDLFPIIYDSRNGCGLPRIEIPGLHVPVFCVDNLPAELAEDVAVIVAAEEIIRIFSAVHNNIPSVNSMGMKKVSQLLRISNFLDNFGYRFGFEMVELLSFGRYSSRELVEKMNKRRQENDNGDNKTSPIHSSIRRDSTIRYIGRSAGVLPLGWEDETSTAGSNKGGRNKHCKEEGESVNNEVNGTLYNLYQTIGMLKIWENIPDEEVFRAVESHIEYWHGLGGAEEYPGVEEATDDILKFFSGICDDLNSKYQISAMMDIVDQGVPMDVVMV